jgi:hypothetical protein
MNLYHNFYLMSIPSNPIANIISPNVPGCKRRFASPYKGLRSKTGAGKLWRSEAWEWSEAERPSRTEPEPPKAAKRLQSCYAMEKPLR